MQEPTTSEDGRIARRLGNRARILDALFALIRAGTYHPTLKQIAAHAGVTPRTLLNHFPDAASLLMAAAYHGRELAATRLPPLPDVADPEERVREFFRRGASFYDGFGALRWSLVTNPATLAVFEANRYKGVALGLLNQRVIELMNGFDKPLDATGRRALTMMTDPLTWRLLRIQQGLSRVEAARTMSASVIALARSSAPKQETKRNGRRKPSAALQRRGAAKRG
ncbi:MAG TPA: TetR/AcrR family transcriptional regulator [Polyangiales bacterium]|nr:TetR/AcrR family transcriptional regulator [Polyangiales bacterium]